MVFSVTTLAITVLLLSFLRVIKITANHTRTRDKVLTKLMISASQSKISQNENMMPQNNLFESDSCI